MRVKFNLCDTAFIGDPSSVQGRESRYIEWDRACGSDGPTFYTHEQMFRPNVVEDAYGWLIESKAIVPGVYREVPKHLLKFKKVFTHDAELLHNFPEKCVFAPGGGVWIGGWVGKGTIGLHQKSKNISLVASDKLMCPLHLFRHRVAQRLKESPLVDVFGTGVGRPRVPIAETLEEYRFSVIIENDIAPYWFTEKLLNCFATGTIPIYIGATEIWRFFNGDGIIQTDSVGLLNAIKRATPKFYESQLHAVKENLELCHDFEVIEDFIFEQHFTKENVCQAL